LKDLAINNKTRAWNIMATAAAAGAERKIKLKSIAHVYYQHADLEKANEFLIDFGKYIYCSYFISPFYYFLPSPEVNLLTSAI
jgi:hypothetical protein